MLVFSYDDAICSKMLQIRTADGWEGKNAMKGKKAFGFRLGLVLAACLLSATAAFGRDWVDFTVVGYQGTNSTLENFPVPVRISAARIEGFSYADLPNGTNDFIFSSTTNQAPYPFEVETWNPEGESIVWVRIPSLSGTNTKFRMSFNLGRDYDIPDPTNVWSTANYRGVWHMHDDFDTSASANTQRDSSGNGFTATYSGNASGGSVSTSWGIIGKGFSKAWGKTSSNVAVTTPNLTSTMKINWNGCTMSGWSYWSGFAANNQYWFFYLGTSSTGSYYWGLNLQSKLIRAKFSTNDPILIGSGLSIASGWCHWAIRVTNQTSYQYFLNGKLLMTLTKDKKFSTQSTASSWYNGGKRGYLDEYRFRNAASSDDWLQAEYDSIKNANFIVAGPVQKGRKLIFFVK